MVHQCLPRWTGRERGLYHNILRWPIPCLPNNEWYVCCLNCECSSPWMDTIWKCFTPPSVDIDVTRSPWAPDVTCLIKCTRLASFPCTGNEASTRPDTILCTLSHSFHDRFTVHQHEWEFKVHRYAYTAVYMAVT